jgi:pyruvate formate lyase activating enzyme
MQIHGFNKTTLLDYPKHLAATVFLGGCNMRCPFCHNASLVTDPNSQPSISPEDVLTYLNKRRNILEGVCVTGGEPTIYPELPDFIKQIKALGFKVKLDTNGTNPSMLKYLVREKLIDYVAMDIKNSPEKYAMSSGVATIDLQPIKESVAYLLTEPVDYEFRTTVVKELHTEQDMSLIGQWLRGAKAYHIQAFRDSEDIIVPGYSSHSKETLEHFVQILSPYITQVSLRGIE